MPSHRLPSLDRLLVFDAAARQRSFTRAARELFFTQSAVSRRVAVLAEELGVPLCVRGYRALDLTDDGRRLVAAVAEALAGLQATVAQFRAPHGREVPTITTTPGLALLWLIPRLAGFTVAHPGVDVRIDASHELRSLASDGYDLAIRYGRSGAMQGTPLFDEVVVPMCAPVLLKRPGAAEDTRRPETPHAAADRQRHRPGHAGRMDELAGGGQRRRSRAGRAAELQHLRRRDHRRRGRPRAWCWAAGRSPTAGTSAIR